MNGSHRHDAEKQKQNTKDCLILFILIKLKTGKNLYGVSSDDSSHLGEDLKGMRRRLSGSVRRPLDRVQHSISYNLYDDKLDIHSVITYRDITQIFCTV